jgi:predicted Fe-Mo cluster-binding NifX family protein
MKIAVITDQGATISQHFGRASQYVVLNVEEGKITTRETRPKAGHHNFAAGGHQEHGCGNEAHGYGTGASDKHDAMSSNILDCAVLLAGGMGWGAYESLRSHNIEPIITDIQDIEQAVTLYLENKLPNLMQRLH